MLSFAYILALKSLPDSTRSIVGSSPKALHSERSNWPRPDRVGVRVGVEGELQNPGRSVDPRGEQKPVPFCMPQEQDPPILALPSCRLRMEEVSSLTELNEPLGDIGGESEGGDIGGEARMEVGEETKSKRWRMGGEPK